MEIIWSFFACDGSKKLDSFASTGSAEIVPLELSFLYGKLLLAFGKSRCCKMEKGNQFTFVYEGRNPDN